MKLKRTQADKYFSDCIRIRANWFCERCGGDFYGNRGDLHCSHFVGRAKLSTRLHPANCFAHCYRCHKLLGGDRWRGANVAEFTEFFDTRRGPMIRHFVTKLGRMPFRYFDQYEKDMATHYRLEFRRMEELRKDGSTKYLQFDMYPEATELNAIMKDIKDELKRDFDENGILKVSKNTGLYKEFAQF